MSGTAMALGIGMMLGIGIFLGMAYLGWIEKLIQSIDEMVGKKG